mmetsp:Transcript_107646/g.185610  ORF Transcript_107646/g.185610 Transcript_107646/m.185610 type:complete len:216 (+) Transcript_107646:562-1209(+)
MRSSRSRLPCSRKGRARACCSRPYSISSRSRIFCLSIRAEWRAILSSVCIASISTSSCWQRPASCDRARAHSSGGIWPGRSDWASSMLAVLLGWLACRIRTSCRCCFIKCPRPSRISRYRLSRAIHALSSSWFWARDRCTSFRISAPVHGTPCIQPRPCTSRSASFFIRCSRLCAAVYFIWMLHIRVSSTSISCESCWMAWSRSSSISTRSMVMA